MKIIKYSSKRCGPCRILSVILSELQVDYTEIDIEENPEKVIEENIKSVPTLIIEKDDGQKKRIVGLKTKKELSNEIFG